MKQRKEQEERFKKTLNELKPFVIAGKLQIRFEGIRTRNIHASAEVGLSEAKDKAILCLAEPDTDKDYNDWAEALAKVFEVLDDVEQYRTYKLQSPVFWEAIQSDFQFSNLKANSDG